jgi:hypothetical protein
MQIVAYVAISMPKHLKMKKMQTSNGDIAVYMGKGGQCKTTPALTKMKGLILHNE